MIWLDASKETHAPKDQDPDSGSAGMGILHRKDRVFILINIFIKRKLSPGRVCLLILIYSVSLNGFCEGKGNDGVFGQRLRGKKERGFILLLHVGCCAGEGATECCDGHIHPVSCVCLQIFNQGNGGQHLPSKCL